MGCTAGLTLLIFALVLLASLLGQASAAVPGPVGFPGCVLPGDCESKVCLVAGLIPGLTTSVCGCGKDADCGTLSLCKAGLCVFKKYAPAGCATGKDCMSGKCVKYKCQCLTDNHCDNLSYCRRIKGTPNKCVPFKLVGAQCKTKRECRSDYCYKGFCRDCKDNTYCACNKKSRTCLSTDLKVDGSAGSECSKTKKCLGAMPCRKGRCVCRFGSDCIIDGRANLYGQFADQHGICRKSVNRAAHRCLGFTKLPKVPNGCTDDGACPRSLSDGSWTQLYGKCVGKRCLSCGAPAKVDEDCPTCKLPYYVWCSLKNYSYVPVYPKGFARDF